MCLTVWERGVTPPFLCCYGCVNSPQDRVARDARDRIVVLDARLVGDPAVDRALGLVVADPRPHPIVRWLALFDTEVMRDTVRDDLIARGALVGFCDAAGILRRLVTPIDPDRLKVHREADVAQAVRRIIAARRDPSADRLPGAPVEAAATCRVEHGEGAHAV